MDELLKMVAEFGVNSVILAACLFFIWRTSQQAREDQLNREQKMFNTLDKFGDSLNDFNKTLITIDKRLENVERKVGQ